MKLYKYTSVIGFETQKMFSTEEKLKEYLAAEMIKGGAGMSLTEALEDGLIKIKDVEIEVE